MKKTRIVLGRKAVIREIRIVEGLEKVEITTYLII